MADFSKQATDRFIEVGGIDLHYNEAGSGPVLLCTHGGGPGATAWGGLKDAVAALARTRRVLLLDLPNFGESQKHVKNTAEFPDVFLAQLFGRFLDALGIDEPVSIYSSSGGGPSAFRFALDFPERVDKLVIQAYLPGMVPKPGGIGFETTKAFSADPSRENFDRIFDFMAPDPPRSLDEARELRWQAASAPGHVESRAEFATLSKNSDIVEELGSLPNEVLFVWGVADQIVPAERALKALQTVPNSRAHIWGGTTGHLVPSEQPEEFAKVVTDFLAE